jgi:hypothetical protein
MTGRELFGALTRFFGLFVTVYATYTLGYEIVGLMVTSLPHRVAPTTGIVFGAVYAVVGLIFLFGGGWISRHVYREKNSN